MKIEEGKTYKIWLEGFDYSYCLLHPIGDGYQFIRPKTKNFRYTHYINFIGHNLNEVNNDYINDSIKMDQPIPISDGQNGITYVKVLRVSQIG